MARLFGLVEDTDLTAIVSNPFDLAIFASGYETRCRWAPSKVSPQRLGDVLVLGFRDHQDHPERLRSDQFFRSLFSVEPSIITGDRPDEVSRLIHDKLSHITDQVRILVDISSMSRNWYADILNWARFRASARHVEIIFSYTCGKYPDVYPPRTVSDTVSLFGFEGRNDTQLETVALIGLGYDPITPLAVVEDLEPELKYAFIANSGDELNLHNTVEMNRATIDELDGPPALAPLMSIQGAYQVLGEMAAPHVGLRNTVFVCLGPKTHVLASLLVGCRNEEISCLHVRGSSASPFDVQSIERVAACIVSFYSDAELASDPLVAEKTMI